MQIGKLDKRITLQTRSPRLAKVLTLGGDLTNSSDQSKFGSESIYADGTGDYLDIKPLTDFQNFMKLGNNFTFEMWVYPTVGRTFSLLEAKAGSTLLMGVYAFYRIPTGDFSLGLNIGASTIYNYLVTPSFALNQWSHIVVQRTSNQRPQLIVNGNYYPVGTPSIDNNNWTGLDSIKTIGFPDSPGLTGYVNEIRASNTVRYPTYTAPTAPFSNDANTILLVHGDGTIADDNSPTYDDYGQVENNWTNYATVWANIKPLSGREKAQMQMVDSILTHRVTIRYNASFMPPTEVDAWRISYETPSGTRIFNITAAQDVDEARKHIQFECTEGSQTGAA